MTEEAKWIRFREVAYPGLTQRWAVETLDGGTLGRICWFGRWRQYCFFPDEKTVYERQCLRDIASFCESKTREYMRNRPKKEQAVLP